MLGSLAMVKMVRVIGMNDDDDDDDNGPGVGADGDGERCE